MRLAKNPNAKSRYVSRSIRNRRTTIDPADMEISSEDVEALEACDGTEEGSLAAFCEDDSTTENFKLTKVLPANFRSHLSTRKWIITPYFSLRWAQKPENWNATQHRSPSGARDTFQNVMVKEFTNTASIELSSFITSSNQVVNFFRIQEILSPKPFLFEKKLKMGENGLGRNISIHQNEIDLVKSQFKWPIGF